MKRTYSDGTSADLRVLAGPADCGNVFGFYKPGLIPAGKFAVVSDGEYSNGGRGPSVEVATLFATIEAAEAEMRRLCGEQ